MTDTRFGSHKMLSDEWFTPRYIIENLGPFDLDPCTSEYRPFDIATEHLSWPHGLTSDWYGRVFLNPPYGNEVGLWMEKMYHHRNGIALIFARPDTRWFQNHVFPVADSILFVRGRIRFLANDGRSQQGPPAPSCLIAYTDHDTDMLRRSRLPGSLWRPER